MSGSFWATGARAAPDDGPTKTPSSRAGRTVALASGRAETHAIIGALRSKLVGILVTDEDTARLVLGAAR